MFAGHVLPMTVAWATWQLGPGRGCGISHKICQLVVPPQPCGTRTPQPQPSGIVTVAAA